LDDDRKEEGNLVNLQRSTENKKEKRKDGKEGGQVG
jgi:hypothetical protein